MVDDGIARTLVSGPKFLGKKTTMDICDKYASLWGTLLRDTSYFYWLWGKYDNEPAFIPPHNVKSTTACSRVFCQNIRFPRRGLLT